MSRVSVIIPARNAAATVSLTLASLVPDAGLIGEVLLVDHGSSDATVDRAVAAAKYAGLELAVCRLSPCNAGAARNAGLDRARFPLVYFIDPDDVLLPGGLQKLVAAMDREQDACLAIGTSIRKTPGLKDLARVPSGFGSDPVSNAELHILNRTPPISMGSGLVRMDALRGIRFPETIAIDEGAWFWTALLASGAVAATTEPVLENRLDSQRAARRYLDHPRRSWLDIGGEFRRLRGYGISETALEWRKAWLAQCFAHQLIRHGRYEEAAGMMRPVLAHRELGRQWRTLRDKTICGFGERFLQKARPAPVRHGNGPHRTLVLCDDPAWPPVSGGDLRNWQNAVAAATAGAVHLVSLRPHDRAKAAPSGITLASLTEPGAPRTTPLNRPRSSIEPRIPRIALDRLLDEVRRFRPDTVVVEGIGLQAFIRPLRSHVPQIVLDMHNVESDLIPRIKAQDWKPATARIDAGRIVRHEARALKMVDRVWTCTRADRDRLFAWYGHRTLASVVPNSIPRFDDIPSDPGAGPDRRAAPVILFVGHLAYRPNVDAAVRLVRDIFPLIREAFPDAMLLLAGRSPKPAVRAVAGVRGVELHENPDSLAPLLGRAHLSLVPLRNGGGSRIKILEAAAWGVPVVATPIAAEGLELEPGRHILLGETDAELARLTVGLLKDASRWSALRGEARAAVLDLYGPEAISGAVRDGLGLAEPA